MSTHKLMSGVAIYFLISMLLKIIWSIDILIPCLWKLIFNTNCVGCGLTTAMMKLLQLDLYGGFQANPLILIILPMGLFYVIHDFQKSRKEVRKSF